jgi:flagellar basal body P-ring formation protein FlgA
MGALLLLLALSPPLAGPPAPAAGAPDAPAAPGLAAPLVHRGERVQLSARIGAVIAQVEAEALQDGRLGEVIRVRNLHSGRVQQGRVLRPGQVEVMN